MNRQLLMLPKRPLIKQLKKHSLMSLCKFAKKKAEKKALKYLENLVAPWVLRLHCFTAKSLGLLKSKKWLWLMLLNLEKQLAKKQV